MVYRLTWRTNCRRGVEPGFVSRLRGAAAARQTVLGILTEGPAAGFASRGARRLPGHLDPVAVRVQAFERYVGWFIVAFHNGDALGVHAVHQRAHLNWLCGLEPGMQERRRRLDVPDRVQGQVEAIGVADDDSAVRTLPSGSRVEAEIIRIELLAAPFVADRQPEMPEVHDAVLPALTDHYK